MSRYEHSLSNRAYHWLLASMRNAVELGDAWNAGVVLGLGAGLFCSHAADPIESSDSVRPLFVFPNLGPQRPHQPRDHTLS